MLMVLATLGGADVRSFVAPLKQNKYLVIYIHAEIYTSICIYKLYLKMSSIIYTLINCMKNITCFLSRAHRRALA